MHLMRHKVLFFIFSSLIILPGLYYLVTSGLHFGIDFTGGASLELHFKQSVDSERLKKFGQVIPNGGDTYTIRTKPIEDQELNKLKQDIKTEVGDYEERSVENIGPVIGDELKRKASMALVFACVMIVLYITYSFRKVPKPASSFRFGVAAIAALIHDVLIVIGSFAILGKFFGAEIDTLFVTALLTVIGFSVHDTIVVFDRIRENLPKHQSMKFSDVADISITQTLARSLNTSLTVVLVLLALLLFGGETIKWFVLALLIGIISGTYSSIFNATALLVWWEERLGH
jgi:preprotein translocase subunit SecF